MGTGTFAVMNFLLMLVNMGLAVVNSNRGHMGLAWACVGASALACLLFIFCLAHTPRPW
jgi:Na+-driven multidrug efflux pump